MNLQPCISTPTSLPLQYKTSKVYAIHNHSYAIHPSCVSIWGQHPISECAPTLMILDIEVDEIAGGAKHGFAWKDNSVYCWGSNQNYQLGLEEEKEYSPEKVDIFQEAFQAGYKLKSISCGDHHTIAAFSTTSKQLHQDDSQQLPSSAPHIIQSSEVPSPYPIFGWGQSDSYQLTLPTTSIIPYPVLSSCSVSSLNEIRSRSDFNIAVCKGDVYAWGCNLFGRLGVDGNPNQIGKIRIPKKIKISQKIHKIGIGIYHVVAVAEGGEAYSWGKGNLGQLGIDRYEAEVKPQRMICNQPIIDVSCGEQHTLVLLRSGKLRSCGSNLSSALGHTIYDSKDKKKRCKKLEIVEADITGQIIEIASGNKHNLIKTKEGTVYGWGDNSHHQIIPIFQEKQIIQKQIKSTEEKFLIKVNKAQKKPLQIRLDSHENSLKLSNIDSIQEEYLPHPCFDKLLDWRVRFQKFQRQKRFEQEHLMHELEELMEALRKQC